MPPELRDYLETVKGCADASSAAERAGLCKIEAGKLELEHVAFDLRQRVGSPCRPFLAWPKAREWTYTGWCADVPICWWELMAVGAGHRQPAQQRAEIHSTGEVSSLFPCRLDTGSSHAKIRRQDTGTSIPAAKQSAVFEAFASGWIHEPQLRDRDWGWRSVRGWSKMDGRIWLEVSLALEVRFIHGATLRPAGGACNVRRTADRACSISEQAHFSDA
jgi:hypothetical protein